MAMESRKWRICAGRNMVVYSFVLVAVWLPRLIEGIPVATQRSVNNSSEVGAEGNVSTHVSTPAAGMTDVPRVLPTACYLNTTDAYMYERVRDLLDNKIKLIEYDLSFVGYSYNPLIANVTLSYNPNLWTRISSAHGQTLLSLAFNYGVLSLMTLTFGTASLKVELQDNPRGCFGQLDEKDMEITVVHLLVRDFRHDEDIAFETDERACHEIIVDNDGVGEFTDQCCHRHVLTGEIICTTLIRNIWLQILIGLLYFVRVSVLFFGPIMFIPLIDAVAQDTFPYAVKLKDPLFKTICAVKSDTPMVPYKWKNILDFRRCKGLCRLRQSAANIKLGVPTKVKIDQYDILVDYQRLLTENYVPVGLWKCIGRAIFRCKLRQVGPFRQCCEANMLKGCSNRTPRPWIDLWRKVGRLLMIICLPFPYYLRLIIYYCFEKAEIDRREGVLSDLGLETSFDKSLLLYLTPTHPLFICIYVLYFITAIILAYMARKSEKGKLKKIIIGSFVDLKKQSWLSVLDVAVSNVIWPFKKFGLLACLVAPFYWLIVIPITLIVYIPYCLSTVYLTIRMLFHSKEAIFSHLSRKRRGKKALYKVQKTVDSSKNLFNVEFLFDRDQFQEDEKKLNPETSSRHSRSSVATSVQSSVHTQSSLFRRAVEHLLASILCILSLYAVLLIMAECLGCLVEILVFTLMGIIINAGAVLKYVMLILLVILYSYGIFNNVPKKYLKLNKAIFNEVKGRCKDLDKVTSLPSYLQENRGFKSQELSEQADYESPDDVCSDQLRQWMINDLTLFIDNEDMPRIPRQLFDEVCEIRVAGAPGPVYGSLIEAGKQFLMIVCFLLFVFIIVLSFGAIYNVSSTNQMLATAAGGFMPFILKNFMQPDKPDIEIGTVSFKSKLDEIIKNFFQTWPVYDFPFKIPTEEDLKKEEEEVEGEKKKEKEKEVEKKDKDTDEKQPEKENKDTNSKDQDQDKLKDQNANDSDVFIDDKSIVTPHKKTLVVLEEGDPTDVPLLPKEREEWWEHVRGRTDVIRSLSEEENVDILIYLPEKYDDTWLREWTDYSEYEVQQLEDVEMAELNHADSPTYTFPPSSPPPASPGAPPEGTPSRHVFDVATVMMQHKTN